MPNETVHDVFENLTAAVGNTAANVDYLANEVDKLEDGAISILDMLDSFNSSKEGPVLVAAPAEDTAGAGTTGGVPANPGA